MSAFRFGRWICSVASPAWRAFSISLRYSEREVIILWRQRDTACIVTEEGGESQPERMHGEQGSTGAGEKGRKTLLRIADCELNDKIGQVGHFGPVGQIPPSPLLLRGERHWIPAPGLMIAGAGSAGMTT